MGGGLSPPGSLEKECCLDSSVPIEGRGSWAFIAHSCGSWVRANGGHVCGPAAIGERSCQALSQEASGSGARSHWRWHNVLWPLHPSCLEPRLAQAGLICEE